MNFIDKKTIVLERELSELDVFVLDSMKMGRKPRSSTATHF